MLIFLILIVFLVSTTAIFAVVVLTASFCFSKFTPDVSSITSTFVFALIAIFLPVIISSWLVTNVSFPPIFLFSFFFITIFANFIFLHYVIAVFSKTIFFNSAVFRVPAITIFISSLMAIISWSFIIVTNYFCGL